MVATAPPVAQGKGKANPARAGGTIPREEEAAIAPEAMVNPGAKFVPAVVVPSVPLPGEAPAAEPTAPVAPSAEK